MSSSKKRQNKRTNRKEYAVKKYSLIDPFPVSMARFFHEITVKDPQQARYLTEWGYDELKDFLLPLKDRKTNEFTGFKVKEDQKEKYINMKKQLNLY